ncbi:MAG: MBL fold metallo-hydrolase, partial [Acidimicrobiia bacterium]|nr:MBL fold metallo-hydrolase [Acidimicrobiia bacterium]
HDAQYTDDEYADKTGWGHSTFTQAIAFAELVRARTMVTFHHDPAHSDEFLDHVMAAFRSDIVDVVPGMVGASFDVKN